MKAITDLSQLDLNKRYSYMLALGIDYTSR
jgi:hypothetical protein